MLFYQRSFTGEDNPGSCSNPGMQAGCHYQHALRSGGDVDDQRGFVTVREFNAVEAISPYFMRQFLLVHFGKTELLEKCGLVRKHKHSCHLEISRFMKALPDEFGADAALQAVLTDGERPELSQSVPTDVKGAYPDERTVLFIDMEITQMLIQLIERPRKHLTCIRVLIDKCLHRLDID